MIELFAKLLEKGTSFRGSTLRKIKEGIDKGGLVSVIRYQSGNDNYALSYVDDEGAHILIPFLWELEESVTVTKALIKVSSR